MTALLIAVAQAFLEQGYGTLVATRGGSMEPLIPSGGIIQVEPVKAEGLRLGDVAVYRQGKTLVAHRLVGRIGSGANLRLITKGDAASWRGRQAIEPGQILGRVCAVNWRRGLSFRITSGWGRMLSLILGVSWPVSQAVYLLLVKGKITAASLRRAFSGSGMG